MKTRLLPAALALLLLLPAMAWANPSPDDFDKGVGKARDGMKARDPQATLQGLRLAVAAAWTKLPFTVLEVHLTAAMPSGFGQYITRVDNVYRPNEPLILYMEPVGYKVNLDQANSTYSYKLAADFNLIDSWGRVVSGRRDFGRFSEDSRHFPDRIPLIFTYSLGGLPPGDYRVETTLRDLLGNQSHTIVTPFKIEGL